MAAEGGNGKTFTVVGILLTLISAISIVQHQRASVTESDQRDLDLEVRAMRDAVSDGLEAATESLHELELALARTTTELAAYERLREEHVARLDRVQSKGEALDNAVTAIGEKLREIETQFREARSFTTLSDAQITQRIDANTERLDHVEKLIQNGPDSIERRLGAIEATGPRGGE